MPKTILTLIAAVAKNGVIGKDNRLPWHLPADLRHFKALTSGHAVIMGRKTWESLPEKFRPLPGRQNIVVTRNAAYAASGATVAGSLPDAVAAAEILRSSRTSAIADRLQLTEIDAEFDGDTWFPARDPRQWREVAREMHRDETGPGYAFVRYDRI